MFKKSREKTVAGYLAAVPKERQETMRSLHVFIQKAVPSLKPHFATNMIGYGTFPYLNYKKEQIQWPVIALANQKQYISLYICSIVDGEYVAEQYKQELGKVSVGRSCIRFKRMEDVHLPTLRRVLKLAAKHPGLTQT